MRKQLYLMRLTHSESHCPALNPDELEALKNRLQKVVDGKVFVDPDGIELVEFFGKPAKHTFWALVRFPMDRAYSYYAREFRLTMGLRVWHIDEEAALDVSELIPFFEEDIARMRREA